MSDDRLYAFFCNVVHLMKDIFFIVVCAKRDSFIVLSRLSVIDHDRFRPRTTGLHQAIVSIY